MIDNASGQLRKFIWQQGFAIGSLDHESLAADFVQQMRAGIRNQNSSLAMLPSFLSASFNNQQLNKNESVIAIDAGGSNLRVALANLNDKGEIVFDQLHSHPMPGSQKTLDKKQFFESFIHYLQPFLPLSHKVGFCFSYPCEISESLDGKLIRWTKEVQADGVEGTWIGKELNHYLVKNNLEQKKFFLLNDTVACLLANSQGSEKAMKIGLILGTGTNCAFKSVLHKDIINIESGSYEGTKDFPADIRLHKKCHDQHHYNFEKKISGKYLGSLFFELLTLGVEQKLFHPKTDTEVSNFSETGEEFSTQSLNTLLQEKKLPFEIDSNDTDAFIFLAQCVVEKAAYLCAMQLYAVFLYEQEHYTQEQDITLEISVEGSTYYELLNYKGRIQYYLSSFLNPFKVKPSFLKHDFASLTGAAITALSH